MFGRSDLALVIAVVSMSACGGSSTSGDVDPIEAQPPEVVTGRFDVPQSGTARYSGFMNLNLPNGAIRETATGNLSLSVDFSASSDQVTGQARGFSIPSSGSLTGTIFVTAGNLEAEQGNTPPGFEAEISGALRGGSLINSLITGDMVAEFDTTDLSSASGVVFGDVTTTQGIDIFDGSFSVAKQ
ncbi:hypothetical protein SAMN05444003_0982 [Cognatiyoonia sediminum]|uniref:Transferrin-binding protein B C-lobe/N-lobe beta barrel domain-containing protein n=1 Tax=Cognatiyoonia sediminum TaxID=1508389 RepID=A0A1M5MS03_9RHOB|nr:hypothetical protein [Cognatiyoonia sediminum]SHG79985.1 hypothetical protein SAMN05444003_0982 [Cognatiyoonia sediminum]